MALFAASDYFAAMFRSELQECGQKEITINGVDGDTLQQLIEYCYSGEITIDSQNIEKIAKAATMLQFAGIEKNCTEFYTTIFRAANCLGIRDMADMFNMAHLREKAHAFVLEHFLDVSKSDEFLRLDANYLSVLLKDNQLNIQSEGDVFSALMGWAKYDVEDRKRSLDTLLRCVRFKHMEDSVSNQCTYIYSMV